MAFMTPMPVYMRIGDGAEHEIGTIIPDVVIADCPNEDGSVTATVKVGPPLAAMLREAACEAERNGL